MHNATMYYLCLRNKDLSMIKKIVYVTVKSGNEKN